MPAQVRANRVYTTSVNRLAHDAAGKSVWAGSRPAVSFDFTNFYGAIYSASIVAPLSFRAADHPR